MSAEEAALTTNRLAEYVEVVQDWMARWQVGEHGVFRGHTDYNWILVARLFRDPNTRPVNKIGDCTHQVEQQLLLCL